MSSEKWICLSTDENDNYIEYIPITCIAWRLFGRRIALAIVTENEKILKAATHYADVVWGISPIEGIPAGNLAKMARYMITKKLPDDTVCMIHDIDTIPLQNKYYDEVLEDFEGNGFLVLGAELYEKEHPGKFPISCMAGFAKDFVKYFATIECFDGDFDEKDNIKKENFSDESYWAALIKKYNISIQYRERRINTATQWIDRSSFHIDLLYLQAQQYIECNGLRPLHQTLGYMLPIFRYLHDLMAYSHLLQFSSEYRGLDKIR